MKLSDLDPADYAVYVTADVPKHMLMAWVGGWLMGAVERHGETGDDADLQWALKVARAIQARSHPDA
jgi:hypothetical protein